MRERSRSRAGAREEGREWRGGDRQKQAGMYARMYGECLITTACVPKAKGWIGFKRFKISNVMPVPVRFLTFCEVHALYRAVSIQAPGEKFPPSCLA